MSFSFFVRFKPHISATTSFHSGSANGLLLLLSDLSKFLLLAKRSERTWNLSHITFLSSFFLPVVFFLFGGWEVCTGGGLDKKDEKYCIVPLFSTFFFFFSRKHSSEAHTPKRSVCVSHFVVFSFFFFSSLASQPATLHRHLFSYCQSLTLSLLFLQHCFLLSDIFLRL